MPIPIEALTTAALSAALQTANVRQAALSANIANASTADYVPQRLSFEAHLAQARETLHDRGVLDLEAVESLKAQPQPALDAAGQPVPVQLDAEMAELARNAVEAQALLQGLSRHLALLALAAADGRK